MALLPALALLLSPGLASGAGVLFSSTSASFEQAAPHHAGEAIDGVLSGYNGWSVLGGQFTAHGAVRCLPLRRASRRFREQWDRSLVCVNCDELIPQCSQRRHRRLPRDMPVDLFPKARALHPPIELLKDGQQMVTFRPR